MNKEQYLKQRNELMAAAQTLINDGKAAEAKAKMEEVKALDKQWDDIKLEQANLAALQNKTKGLVLENKSVAVEGAKQVGKIEGIKPKDESGLYKVAFYKKLTNRSMNADEENIYKAKNIQPQIGQPQNAFTHDTSNTGILIPETVATAIWKRAEEAYPLYADAQKFGVSGKFSIPKHTGIAAGDAKWYDEPTPTEDEQNTFGTFDLDGRELSKAATVSWKLKSMAMDAFLPFLQNELGDRCGVALGYAAAQGKGSTATPPEPRGVETALIAQAGTPQIVTYDPDNATTPVPLTYDMLVQAVAKLHSSYANSASIYANNATIWNQLATLKDNTGRPLFIPDVTSGGVGRIFGMTVKPDAGLSAGNILFGATRQGLIFNVNEALSLVTEDHAKERTTDYVVYGVVDGDVIDEQAFALIRNLPNA
ncbi:phage major capsid protein [Sporolactobacillus sp. CQH2019]|uniref:phage major capsid protein n=1 Tax=Sporolactobacillus sp. CQH2019 TaxID=3023512 RepID=UPI0023683C48|nr:phage major capsid protein [Sporolactobacillus sp. CQH2019]MDD9148153.1 phage major capsid protein [Sporolactobacillus sp. CQH2019]